MQWTSAKETICSWRFMSPFSRVAFLSCSVLSWYHNGFSTSFRTWHVCLAALHGNWEIKDSHIIHKIFKSPYPSHDWKNGIRIRPLPCGGVYTCFVVSLFWLISFRRLTLHSHKFITSITSFYDLAQYGHTLGHCTPGHCAIHLDIAQYT